MRLSRRPHRATSTHINESRGHYLLRLVFAILLVVSASLVDVVLIKTTWNVVLLERELVSWLIAVLTALGGAALAWASGAATIRALVYSSRADAFVATATAMVWAAVGAGLFWLRWNGAALAGVRPVLEGQVAGDGGAGVHRTLAVVMIALYLLPGILAWRDGYLLSNPIAAHQRRTHAQLVEFDERIALLEAEGVKVSQLLTMHADEIMLVRKRAEQSRSAHASLADELRAHVRAEVLRHLQDPAAGGITHPDEQPSLRGGRPA